MAHVIEAEHQQVMAERRGEQEPVDDEVGIGAHDFVGRGLEQGPGRAAVEDRRPADEERQRKQRGEDRADGVGLPAGPPTGVDPAEGGTADGGPEEVGQLVAAEDQRRVVQRPRERRADEQDEPDREPPVRSPGRVEQVAVVTGGHEIEICRGPVRLERVRLDFVLRERVVDRAAPLRRCRRPPDGGSPYRSPRHG